MENRNKFAVLLSTPRDSIRSGFRSRRFAERLFRCPCAILFLFRSDIPVPPNLSRNRSGARAPASAGNPSGPKLQTPGECSDNDRKGSNRNKQLHSTNEGSHFLKSSSPSGFTAGPW